MAEAARENPTETVDVVVCGDESAERCWQGETPPRMDAIVEYSHGEGRRNGGLGRLEDRERGLMSWDRLSAIIFVAWGVVFAAPPRFANELWSATITW